MTGWRQRGGDFGAEEYRWAIGGSVVGLSGLSMLPLTFASSLSAHTVSSYWTLSHCFLYWDADANDCKRGGKDARRRG